MYFKILLDFEKKLSIPKMFFLFFKVSNITYVVWKLRSFSVRSGYITHEQGVAPPAKIFKRDQFRLIIPRLFEGCDPRSKLLQRTFYRGREGPPRDHKHRRSAYGVSLATIICLPMFSNGIPLRFNVTRILQGREREGTDHFSPPNCPSFSPYPREWARVV